MTEAAFPCASVEPTVRDMIEAIGGLAAMLAVHLDREGVVTLKELSGHLGMFATITDETSPAPAAILAYWASIIGTALDP